MAEDKRLTLSEIYEGVIENETMAKLATVEKAYADDPARSQMLDEAVDIVKEACVKGELPPMNASEILSTAVEMVETEMLEKEAGEYYNVGEELANVLAGIYSIGPDEVNKIASDEESEEFGRFCARALDAYHRGKVILEDGSEADLPE